nr:transcriptional regulator [Kibdelosporangium phytohabitans]
MPRSHAACTDALAKVDRQIELAKADLRTTAWAGDPVSAYAAERFNARALEEEPSALQALQAYRSALDTLVAKLISSETQYRRTEQDKDATMRGAQ